jgi:beta-galactosidase/beta-glucuronidase
VSDHRSSFPEPLAVRPNYRLLDGTWRFHLHGEDALHPTRILAHEELQHAIEVPFCYQSSLSGLGHDGYYPAVWYSRSFEVTDEEMAGRIRLNFGAVDYRAVVLVNGTWVGEHTGGHTSFHFDITSYVRRGENQLKVKAIDLLDPTQPRGKQSWQAPYSCWYRGCTGIWRSVWLEFTPRQAIDTVRVDADASDGRIDVHVKPAEARPARLRSRVLLRGEELDTVETPVSYPETCVVHRLDRAERWHPGAAVLYDVHLELISPEGTVDRVSSYTAFRTIGLSDGMLVVNDEPVYQRLVLDQGFWADGHYSPPTGEALKTDIELAMAMGFNGCRKHVKAEDPRFYYWADALGYLVWSEFPSPYDLTTEVKYRVLTELSELVAQHRGHPSIVAWTLYNESWGLPHLDTDLSSRQWLRTLETHVRALDPTRLVTDNDGWEHVSSDMFGLHSYAADGPSLKADLRAARQGGMLAGGRPFTVAGTPPPEDRPLVLTEFGGIGFRTAPNQDGWSYDDIPATEAEFRKRFEGLFAAIDADPRLAGFVYTQLTDVESEINGLATPDRTPKFETEWIASVVGSTGTRRE